jgi:hypothetical protein
LARERLTGLLVCTKSSGRPVKPCLDPWPAVYDYQVFPDKSIEPPAEPLPDRWGLNEGEVMKMAPNDATRVAHFLKLNQTVRGTASFVDYQRTLNQNQDRATVQYIAAQDYDGTFVPSSSVRTVEPPEVFKFPWET